MAMIRDEYCNRCETIRIHTDGTCNECYTRDKRTRMAAWQAQTTEEKLLNIHKRLLALERGPIKY